MPHHPTYVPALAHEWLTPVYDRLLGLTMPEKAFRRRLIAQATIRPDHRVLDLGCGTGTLAIMAKMAEPRAQVVGLDGDRTILAIARRKVAAAGVDVGLHHGMAHTLPFGTATFDRIVSSLVFHHLAHDEKCRALAECHRVLAPDGELHIADWGKPQNALMWLASRTIRLFDGPTTADNLQGRLPQLCRDAGFADVHECGHLATVFGTLAFYRARKSQPAALDRLADGRAPRAETQRL